MNDWQLSQWVSRALSGELDQQQRTELDHALASSPACKAFADWSSRIQEAAQWASSAEANEADSFGTERLSELAKERMRRLVHAAQTQWDNDRPLHSQLWVAQTPIAYKLNNLDGSAAQGPIPVPPPNHATSQSTAPSPVDTMLARAVRLRDRLSSQIDHLAEALCLVSELVKLSTLFNAEVTSKSAEAGTSQPTDTRISIEQLAAILLAMLKVDPQLTSVSVATLTDQQFVEALRVQRNARNIDDVKAVATDHLRRGVAGAFHQAIVAAPESSISSTVDNSIAGWARLVLGIPLTVEPPSSASSEKFSPLARRKVVMAEMDIGRFLQCQLAANGITEQVVLLDGHHRILVSFPAANAERIGQSNQLTELQVLLAKLPAVDDEVLSEAGVVALPLACPAPLGNLTLVLIGAVAP